MTVILVMVSAFIVCGVKDVEAVGSGAFRIFSSDAEAIGKAGAFAGEADNPSAIFYNPAGITQLEDQQNISLGLALVTPLAKHTSPSGEETQMRINHFAIPQFYYVTNFGWDRWAFGVGAASGYGAGTEWSADSFSGYVATKTELTNINSFATVAYEMTDQLSLAVGVIHDDSDFNQNKNLNQQPGADARAQLKLNDDSFGYTFSALYKLNERHQFGAQYRSQIKKRYGGKVHITGLNDAGSLPLATIFGGSTYSNDITFSTALPQSVVIGYSFRPDEKWRFNMDIEWTDWSSIEQEKLFFPGETNPTRLAILDASTFLPLDWNSVWAIGVGGEYRMREWLTFRFGYVFHQTPIPEANFNTFLPDSNSHGISAGVGFQLNPEMTLDVSYLGLIFEDRKINNNVGVSSGASLDGEYEEFISIVQSTFTMTLP